MAPNPHFLVTSIALYFCYIAYGLAYNIWGPTWVNLVSLLNSTQDEMAYGNSLMAIGYTVGAFSGGFIFNYLNRQILVSFYLFLMALSTTLTPIVKSYQVFLVFAVIFGLGEGGFDTACNAWILEMWREDNGPYMQAMYFTFGLGSLLAPLISLDFVGSATDSSVPLNSTYDVKSGQYGSHHHNSVFPSKLLTPLMKRFNGSLVITANDNNTSGIDITAIYIPYCITGGLLLSSALIIIIMYFIKKYEPILDSDNENCDQITRKSSLGEPSVSGVTDREQTLNNNFSDEKHLLSNRDISRRYLISMVAIGGVMLCFYEGMENINFEYQSTFFDSTKLDVSEETSDLIVSAMSAAYTIGRGIGIFVAVKVRPKYFLYADLILISIGNAILYFFANTSVSMSIVGTVILGLGFSTFFPCIYSYLEEHIHLTNVICGLLMVSCASIATVDPIIVGKYIKDNPFILLYVNIGSTVLVTIAFLATELITSVNKTNHSK